MSLKFLKQVLAHNSSLAHTSLGCRLVKRPGDRLLHNFQICGAVYHKIGLLLTQVKIDPPNLTRFISLILKLLMFLSFMFLSFTHGCYKTIPLHVFCNCRERIIENLAIEVTIVIKHGSGCDCQRYNSPTLDEVAIILARDAEVQKHDIII